MKKLITTALLLISSLHATTNVSVTIEPQKRIVKAIGGELVNVNVMVQSGDDPHTYEPRPKQMVNISKSDIYFAVGLEFEKVWLPKFQALNKKMLISDLSIGIKKIEVEQCHIDHEGHGHHHEGSFDPHIWTSPQNIKLMALNTFVALSLKDKTNKKIYEKNLNKFLNTIDTTDMTIKGLLAGNGKAFMVFHPSWSYFAKYYNLEQIVVEVQGKEPKPKELIDILEQAKKSNVKAIFTQSEFSSKSVKIIAKELNIPIVSISNLDFNIENTLIELARYIADDKK